MGLVNQSINEPAVKKTNPARPSYAAGQSLLNLFNKKNEKVNDTPVTLTEQVEEVKEEPNYTPATTTPTYDYSGLVEALQRISQEKYSALENALLRNKQLSDDQANAQYARNLRQWKRTYGNGLTGEGLSQKFGLMANRDSTLAQNQTDYLNNVATAKSGKYDDYSNLTSSLSGIDSTSLKKILSLI